jgi:hypothetical protein
MLISPAMTAWLYKYAFLNIRQNWLFATVVLSMDRKDNKSGSKRKCSFLPGLENIISF